MRKYTFRLHPGSSKTLMVYPSLVCGSFLSSCLFVNASIQSMVSEPACIRSCLSNICASQNYSIPHIFRACRYVNIITQYSVFVEQKQCIEDISHFIGHSDFFVRCGKSVTPSISPSYEGSSANNAVKSSTVVWALNSVERSCGSTANPIWKLVPER